MLDANVGPSLPPILDQHWPYIQLHWAMLGFPYWANIAPMQWPYIGPMAMSKLHWAYVGCQCWPIIAANIGPTLALYTTTLGHAWLPILGQHCDNAVALYWANEQTALGLCWMPMLAHHCRQYWTNIGPIYNYIGPYLASHIGPTLRQCSGPILANEQTALGLCWVPMLAHHCCQYGPILACWLGRQQGEHITNDA